MSGSYIYPIVAAGIAFVVIAVIAKFAVWLLPRVDKEPAKYGTVSQAIQALVAIVFGMSSASVAFSVFLLQQNERNDSALDRAATLIERLHEEGVREERALDSDVSTAGHRAYDCIIYLKYRVAYTPHWTAAKLASAPYLMSPEEIGKDPDRRDVSDDQSRHWPEISDQFDRCVGRDVMDQKKGHRSGTSTSIPTAAQISKRGAKMRRLISYVLSTDELALMEWPSLPDASDARKLLEHAVASDVCTSLRFKADVFDLFATLHHSIELKNEASKFSGEFLKDYPNLDQFLVKVCQRAFAEMEESAKN
jgi:hypothetical protein